MKSLYALAFFMLVAIFTNCQKGSSAVVLQSITFSPETLTVQLGSTTTLSPVFTPKAFENIPCEWSSSQPAVVTVISNGVVFASAIGQAFITVKDKNSSIRGKCLVIVQ